MCSIPVYYWVIDNIWLHELDEHNHIVKQKIENGLTKAALNEKELEDVLKLWNRIQPETKLIPVQTAIRPDSVYTSTRKTDEEEDRFRGLAAYITANGKTYLLTTETNIEEADETIAAIAFVTFVFFSLLVAGFIFLNKSISKSIWRPFSDTLKKLQSFDLAKDQKINFDQTDIEEFQQLNNTLDKLIKENISTYNQQKVFIENASHELQTPLAVLRSKIDILLQNKDMTTEQLNILESIEMPVSRMTRINKNLLLLAKIENRQFGDVNHIDLSAIVQESSQLVADYIQNKELKFKNSIARSFFVDSNTFLLETLVNNLLINSIRHTPNGGQVTIDLQGSILVFSNSGEAALNPETLFERFGISSGTNVSSGLGLSIIKEICNRYQWKINYSFAGNFHRFSVDFG